MQLELFDYRKDYLFESDNQIAHYYDVLSETHDSISYSEHIDPKKGYAICGMEYEEYVDVKTNTCDTSLRLYRLPQTFTLSLQLKMLIKADFKM